MAKSNSLDVSVEEWLKELESLAVVDVITVEDGAYTSEDLRRMSGLGERAIFRRLRELHRAGRLEVGKREGINIAGGIKIVPTYRLKKKGKSSGK